jgi:hypothetical protein
MDKKLQKFILNIVKDSQGEAAKSHILNKTSRGYFKEVEMSPKTNTDVQHQLNLLEKENKLYRKDQLPDTPYILTRSGCHELGPWWKKVGRFIMYDKNNLLGIFSLLISIIALIFSVLCQSQKNGIWF